MRISKSRLSGKLTLPPSKSHTMRSLMLAAQIKGSSTIRNALPSPDTKRMIQALAALGVPTKQGDPLTVEGGLNLEPVRIDVGNSGLAFRFITSLAALGNQKVEVTGDHSIQTRRPIQPLISAIQQLGGKAEFKKGVVHIEGPIRAGKAQLDGSASQPVSALLMTTPFLDGETILTVENPGEKPFIDLTINWLKKLGIQIEHEDYKTYRIQGGYTPDAFDVTIPSDWSSAAFPIVAALVTRSPLQIEGLDPNDSQGDKKIVDWLSAHITGNLFVTPGEIQGGILDVNDCIDAVPILAVLGCFASYPLHLVNAKIARFKESDRLHAITLELRKMGALILEFEDSLTIYPSKLHAATVESHADHRIAMALAVAALTCEGETEILGASCIEKSFPHFAETFRSIGAQIV